MAELWEIFLSIFGAFVVGYALGWFGEKWRRTSEKEMEYRKELKEHLPDLIEPLFKLLGNLWTSLVDFSNPDYVDFNENVLVVKGRKLTTPIREAEETLTNLENFLRKNESKLDLLLPHPLRSWQYGNLHGFVINIIEDARKGRMSFDDVIKALITIMNIQDDFQKILGFETKMRLKSEGAFMKPLSRFERLKRKLRIS